MNRKLHLKLTCTQKLQTFHCAKPYLGSPLKAERLKLGKLTKAASSAADSSGIHFDPRPPAAVSNKSYNSFVRNTNLNFMALQDHLVSVPISQLYEPANVSALESDHDYCEKNSVGAFPCKFGCDKYISGVCCQN